MTYIDSFSEGECDVYNSDAGARRVCFGVSNLQVDWRFDGAGHRLGAVAAPTHLDSGAGNESFTLNLNALIP